MSEKAALPRARLDSLTSLRFFAAFVVLAVHYDLFFFWRSLSLRTAPKVFIQGGVGVSFFFILSGFVLTWSHRPGDSARAFMRRRLARIGPLHVATWAAMIVIVLIVGGWPGVGMAAVSVSLVAPWSPAWGANLALNTPAWSLGCEFFFYLLFPFLFVALSRVQPAARRVIAVVCIVVPLAIAAAVNVGRGQTEVTRWFLYFFPPTRLIEFVLGMVLAMEVAERRLPRVGLIPASLVAGVAYVLIGQAPAPYVPVAVTVAPFALLIVAAAQADSTGRPSILRLRALVTLGVWSFALYLGHWPVLVVMSSQISHALGRGETVLLGLVFLAISIAVAGVLHTVIERPMEVRLRGVPPRAESEAHPAAVLHPLVEAVSR